MKHHPSAEPSELLTRFLSLTEASNQRVAIQDEDESVRFSDLGARARNVAAALAKSGLAGRREGGSAPRRVAMLVTQGSGWVESFFGISLSGCVVVPLSHLHPPKEQRWFVETSQADAVIVSRDLLPELEQRSAEDALGRPLYCIEDLREPTPGQFQFPEDSLADNGSTALILYTSGTTGKPKGALISHQNLGRLAALVGQAWSWRPDDCLLHCLPLHHLHGLGIALLVSLLSGGKTRMLRKFDAAALWEAAAEASVLMGVPTMHKKLLDALDAASPSQQARWKQHAASLRLVTSGSAALPSTVGSRWRELTGDYPLERFGMTEIGVGMSNPIAGPRKPGSCGLPLPGMQLRIVNDAGEDVASEEAGEIWIKGPTVFSGYDQNPAATQEAFVDGWFRSGDTASWDADGYCRILGRTSVDILKSGGYKLSALELEELFREHPAVADVAVVGIPDETWGEIAVASILARPGREAEIDEASLRDWAKQRTAAYKVPKRVLRFDEFPRNPVGKVVKPELKLLVEARL